MSWLFGSWTCGGLQPISFSYFQHFQLLLCLGLLISSAIPDSPDTDIVGGISWSLLLSQHLYVADALPGCLHFYLYFIFNWLAGGKEIPTFPLTCSSLCISAIHQSYLLFNELISFNLFAQVSVAITGAVQVLPGPWTSFKLQLSPG